jgi:hypothetical protein
MHITVRYSIDLPLREVLAFRRCYGLEGLTEVQVRRKIREVLRYYGIAHLKQQILFMPEEEKVDVWP